MSTNGEAEHPIRTRHLHGIADLHLEAVFAFICRVHLDVCKVNVVYIVNENTVI